MKFCTFVYRSVQVTASDKFMTSIKNFNCYATIEGMTKYTIRRVWFFQRGQKNVRNHTQVKLAATSLECKQAGTFQYTSVCVGGRFRLITRIREKN